MRHRYITLASTALLAVGVASAQSAFDAYQISQKDLKGTARFMSMGGAFGALGGDLSSLSQNPAGIGVYRNSDVGFTLDLDCQNATSNADGLKESLNKTNLLLNNIGVVGTWRLEGPLRNINFGFTYNKAASFNRNYGGSLGNIATSMTNYIAGISNSNGLTIADVRTSNGYDPYNPNDGGYVSPWISILGYDGYLANPEVNNGVTDWYGQMGDGTYGNAWYSVSESGCVDEYNLSFGGNISDIFYWGMDFGITDINYTAHTFYGENLRNAYLPDPSGNLVRNTNASWDIYNYYNVNGNGFNYKLGFIVKPVQELRLGFAFHTPTYYSLTQNFYGNVNYNYPDMKDSNGNTGVNGMAETNNGSDGFSDFNFRTPWKLMFSAATVLPVMSGLIVSADYEWEPYNGMTLRDPYNDGWYQGQFYETYGYENQDIRNYYKQMNMVRLGAEMRLTPQWSVRAGYAYQSSPVRPEARNEQVDIFTAGTRPQFSFDNTVNYLTCGAGYKYKKFYVDVAYVYKTSSSEYHAFASDPLGAVAPSAKVSNNDSQIVMSMGFKF